jgi:hypothetical protein
MENKQLEWIKSLKVGDIVCDCRGKHLRIAALEEEYCNPIPKWLCSLIYSERLKLEYSFILEGFFQKIFSKILAPELYDKTLCLEDGAYCSAKNCCVDPNICEHATPDKKEEVQ